MKIKHPQEDEAAAHLGVLGITARQSERYRNERRNWATWSGVLAHWQATGEVIDPATGELLGKEATPPRGFFMRRFRSRVFLLRAAVPESLQ